MDNTRKTDLNELEEARDNATSEDERIKANAALLQVYYQSKDVVLEKLRKKLTDVLIRWAENGEWTDELLREFHTIERKVKTYAGSETYRKNMAKTMEKTSINKANRIYTKGG